MTNPLPFLPCAPMRRLTLALFLLCFLAVGGYPAEAPKRSFDIPAGDALVTLKQFIAQSGAQLLYSADEAEGVRTYPVKGTFSAHDALNVMLARTVLVSMRDESTGTLTVHRSSSRPAAPPPPPRSSGAGSLTGSVSNQATGNLLTGALVEVLNTGKSALTDATGRFILYDLPVGVHTIEVSYLGLDSVRQPATIAGGRQAVLDFELTSAIYQLEAFQVSGEREGNALALTAQRNADNVKNIAALDAYGNLPNLSAGELAIRLPGVAALLDNEGNVTGVLIRGTPADMNRVTVDGNLIANSGGYNRSFQMHSMTGAMFEQLEVTKGQTPDRSADSVGGNVNLVTRSSLNMKEKRRINYNLGARWASPLFDYTPSREAHRIHPQINFSYQEVFDAWGGERNLGVSLNMFYSENVNAPNVINYDYQNTTALPSYLFNYTDITRYANRKQTSFNLKTEYRVSPATKLQLSVIYNDADEFANTEFHARAFANQAIASFEPGYTATFVEARPVAGSAVELRSLLQGFFNRTRSFDLGAEHKWSRWEVDYNVAYSQSHVNLNHAKDNSGGAFNMRALNVGWTLDTSDPADPVFRQTAGPDITDPASYINSFVITNLLRDSDRDSEVWNARLNATYQVDARFPLQLKGGAYFREQFSGLLDRSRRYNYIGSAPLPSGTAEPVAVEKRWGLDLPFVHPSLVNRQVGDASLWREDVYYRESQKYTGTNNATERINAGYIMARARFDHLGVVAGVRTEETKVRGFGYVRVTPGTVAEFPDPAARAEHDWNNPVTNTGSYTRSFPSVHLSYDLTKNLKARASWSTSFGRPAINNLLPTATINATANSQTVTIGNPALGPQYSKNIDLALEYYFRPAGLVSVGYFRKNISDYILTSQIGVVGDGPDNGFLGDYAGYQLLSRSNAGKAEIDGWEFDYRQQLTFLPGYMKGLSLSANYTYLATEGDFGENAVRSTGEVAGFIPRTANASLSYRYGRFGARVLVNYTSSYLQTFAAAEARRLYRTSRTVVNAGVTFSIRPSLTLFCDVANVFDEAQQTYRYVPSQTAMVASSGPAITFGVTGRY